jgi:hypothetical protein
MRNCGEIAILKRRNKMIREFNVKEKSFWKIYKNKNIATTPIISVVVAAYGPEPVGYGGEEVIEKSFEIPHRGIRYLCYEHRY